MIFDNNCSCERFIGNRDLAEVIRQDEQELLEIGGSFEEIARRMQEFIDFAKGKGCVILPSEEFEKYMEPVFDNYNRLYGGLANIQRGSEAERQYHFDWIRRMSEHPATWLDDKVAVIRNLSTRGSQVCPFYNCPRTSSIDVEIVNRNTLRTLKVNPLTVHLARDHHLLEKDNSYGISAAEFYREFM